MHGAQDMLKARVLGTGVHPPGALQLMNSPQALNPGMIDERLLGRLLAVAGGGEGNVTVQRIANQAFGTKVVTCHWSFVIGVFFLVDKIPQWDRWVLRQRESANDK